MTISKTAFTLIVFHDSNTDIQNMAIESVIEEIQKGNFAGAYKSIGSMVCPDKESVIADLEEIGINKSFFDLDKEYPKDN